MATKEENFLKFFLLFLVSVPVGAQWVFFLSGAAQRGSNVDYLAQSLIFLASLISLIVTVTVTIRTRDNWWCLAAIVNFVSLALFLFLLD